jgi:methyl-accepting chemotaxis protein
VANFFSLSRMQSQAATMDQFGKWRTYAVSLINSSGDAANSEGPAKRDALAVMRETVGLMDARMDALLRGNPAQGIAPASDPRLVADLSNSRTTWTSKIKPKLERLASAASAQEARSIQSNLEPDLRAFADSARQGDEVAQVALEEQVHQAQSLQYVFAAIMIMALACVLWFTWAVTRRLRALTSTSARIGAGDFTAQVAITGGDELALLGRTFNSMTADLARTIATEQEGRARLERLLEAVRETASSVASATAEILAGTTQQAAGAQEQAASVAETMSTVNEVLQTSEQASERARTVSEAAQRADDVGRTGRKAVDETVSVMGSIRQTSESTAESILLLAEQAQAIGEIINTVNEIAEQTNLLALNAAIEASRAGEQGKGFSVVAGEVKALAEQSKKATAQVRQILGEIQKATNQAVMVTEEGSKSVQSGIRVVNQAGETIKALSDTISEAAQAAMQIVASASQQVTGMSQIQQAMADINQVSTQNLASTRQAETAVRDLDLLGGRLKELLDSDAG